MHPDTQRVPYGYGSIPPGPNRGSESDRKQHMLEQAILIQARTLDELAISIAVLRIQIGELIRISARQQALLGDEMESDRSGFRRQTRAHRHCARLHAPPEEVCRMPMPPPVWRADDCECSTESRYGVTVGVFAPISIGLLWLAFIALGRGSYLAAVGFGLSGAAMLIVCKRRSKSAAPFGKKKGG